ncbi:MAG: hypothetical protein AB1656_04105 [Candidatus Omnitrophota bacterium]
MTESIFFPHFYLANDVLLRHQYLYSSRLMRIHSSDRPPRDGKLAKSTIANLSGAGFLEDSIPLERSEWAAERFIKTLERAYKENREEYIRRMGKFMKERTSTKTYHLFRLKVWPDAAACAMELGLAVPDSGEIWCFATRQMVMTLIACLTLEQQAQRRLPRCADATEFDELAELLELFPAGSGDASVRAVLEFPYIVPQAILSLSWEELQVRKIKLAPIAGLFYETIQEAENALNAAKSREEIGERLQDFQGNVAAFNRQVIQTLQPLGDRPAVFYHQYRWYPPEASAVAPAALPAPFIVKDVALAAMLLPAAKEETARARSYPGCLVCAMEKPAFERGWGWKMTNWFKRFAMMA